jgi:hypothetical protein
MTAGRKCTEVRWRGVWRRSIYGTSFIGLIIAAYFLREAEQFKMESELFTKKTGRA